MFSRWSRAEVEGSECRSYQRLRETIRQTLAFTASERGSHITSPHTHPPPHLSACVSLVPCVCHENSIKPISVSLCLLAVFSVRSVKPWVLVIWVIRPPAVRIKVCSDAFDTHRSVWYWYSSADADGCVTDAAQSHVFYCKTHTTTTQSSCNGHTHSMKHASTDGEDLTQQPDRQRHTREIHLPLTSWKLWL